MLNILVADDHSIVRKGLIQLLEEEFEINNLGEASTTIEVQQLLPQHQWDIVILDLSMPGKNGIELIKDIKAEFPEISILVLSIYPEEQFAVRVIKAGASGYINKETSTEVLVTAIRKIISGGRFISPEFAEKLLEEMQTGSDIPLHKTLSDREYEVFLLLVEGKAQKDIADVLSLSVKTISTYQTRIFDKMKIHSVAELTRYAMENNLIIKN